MTLAVYPFKGEANTVSLGNKITALVTANLATNGNLALVERARLGRDLDEQAFGVSGLVSASAAAEIGQLSGAKVLVCGNVLMSGENRIMILATIVSAETGRLFSAKVEGAPEEFPILAGKLSDNIAALIQTNASALLGEEVAHTNASVVEIIQHLPSGHRPSVTIHIIQSVKKHKDHSLTSEIAMGSLLLKAGFPVIDDTSGQKPQVEIEGVLDITPSPNVGQLHGVRALIQLKAQERVGGNILEVDHQESIAVGETTSAASRQAEVTAVEALTARLLPLLAR